MTSNAEFIASIEALLAAAKSYYDVEKHEYVARANMLEIVALPIRAPREATFRQLTNVSTFEGLIGRRSI